MPVPSKMRRLEGQDCRGCNFTPEENLEYHDLSGRIEVATFQRQSMSAALSAVAVEEQDASRSATTGPEPELETFVRAWARLAAVRDLRAIGRSRSE